MLAHNSFDGYYLHAAQKAVDVSLIVRSGFVDSLGRNPGRFQTNSRSRPDMDKKRQNEQYAVASGSGRNDLSMPPCCGSGCAVCVLDYWIGDETGYATQEETATEISNHHPSLEEPLEVPLEVFEASPESGLLALLEAFEQAQLEVRQIIAQLDGEAK